MISAPCALMRELTSGICNTLLISLCSLAITAGGGANEFGAVEVHQDGSTTIFAGTSAHGQGHQTAYAMLVSDQTGIPIDQIRLVGFER